ncbi:MAG TPA: peptidoglycan endopeptidase [Allosphingosinicella sp.]|jgi:cell wall-associated NlpC family hydrolase
MQAAAPGMTSGADGVVARARSLIGVRYRPQGRSIEAGLDCVGVAAFSLGLAIDIVPRGYAVRGTPIVVIEAELGRLGLVRVPEAAATAGDLGLFVPGPAQLHLAVITGTGLVHADAALRRVVERPLPAPWGAIGYWRAARPPEPGDA